MALTAPEGRFFRKKPAKTTRPKAVGRRRHVKTRLSHEKRPSRVPKNEGKVYQMWEQIAENQICVPNVGDGVYLLWVRRENVYFFILESTLVDLNCRAMCGSSVRRNRNKMTMDITRTAGDVNISTTI